MTTPAAPPAASAATGNTGTGPTLRRVRTLSGQTIHVQGDGERDFYNNQQKKYTQENSFTAVADMQDLDRLLFLELLVHRASCWLASGRNYYGELLAPSEEADCRKVIKENSPLISTIKNDLKLTKSQRDKEQFESVGKYLTDLKARAREHGIKREKELQRAIVLVNQLSAMIGAFDRADEIERAKLGLENGDEILDWIRTVMLPDFREIDEYFRNRPDGQKFWVRLV